MATDPTPAPAPEWAVKMAFSDVFPSYVKRLGYEGARHELRYIGPESWALMERLALSYASVRDAALREAAEVRAPFAGVVHAIAKPCDACQIAYTTGALDAASAFNKAVMALIGTAPKPTESAPVSEASEEAPRG